MRLLSDTHPSGRFGGWGEPLVPFNSSGAEGRPMAEFAGVCKDRGLWPFVHFNRTHVVPPCTTSAEEIREGIAVLDEALKVADTYYTGRT